MLLGLVDQRGVGLIPYSDVFLFQIYNNQWEYTTGEKFKICLYAEMRNFIFNLLPLLIADEIGGED